jgi:hypothetical protein
VDLRAEEPAPICVYETKAGGAYDSMAQFDDSSRWLVFLDEHGALRSHATETGATDSLDGSEGTNAYSWFFAAAGQFIAVGAQVDRYTVGDAGPEFSATLKLDGQAVDTVGYPAFDESAAFLVAAGSNAGLYLPCSSTLLAIEDGAPAVSTPRAEVAVIQPDGTREPSQTSLNAMRALRLRRAQLAAAGLVAP